MVVSLGAHLCRFCGGEPAAHISQSRLRANESARVSTHRFVCALSVSSVLMVTPVQCCWLYRSR